MLVLRGSRFQGLTPEGQRVLEWARRIVGDARAMREEMLASDTGLSGHIRMAVIPTALAMVPRLTTPFRQRHPDVTFSILSATSIEVLTKLENFEIEAGMTYLENEPLGRVATVALYSERYRLITARRQSVLRPDERDVGGSLRPAALPSHAGHAEPADHQSAPRRSRRQRASDAGIELHDRALRAYPDRQVGIDHADEPRRKPRLRRTHPRHTDRRAGRQPSRGARRGRAGAPYARSSRRCFTKRGRSRSISGTIDRKLLSIDASDVLIVPVF